MTNFYPVPWCCRLGDSIVILLS